MKTIYLVLTHTGTFLSRVIKSFTKDEFSHISISLDIELNQMYSFGRKSPYNPIFAGFVHENINKGIYKRFKHTLTKIYSLEVTDEQYENIINIIKKFENNKELYKFNIIGLIAAGFHKNIHLGKSFYCAEFIKYLFENSDIEVNIPNPPRPEDFKNITGIREIYNGVLQQYEIPFLNPVYK